MGVRDFSCFLGWNEPGIMGASPTFVTHWSPEKPQAPHCPAPEACSRWPCIPEAGRSDYPRPSNHLRILTFPIAFYLIWAGRPWFLFFENLGSLPTPQMKLSSCELLLSGWAGAEWGPTEASEAGQVGVIPCARGGGGCSRWFPRQALKARIKKSFSACWKWDCRFGSPQLTLSQLQARSLESKGGALSRRDARWEPLDFSSKSFLENIFWAVRRELRTSGSASS